MLKKCNYEEEKGLGTTPALLLSDKQKIKALNMTIELDKMTIENIIVDIRILIHRKTYI